MLDALVRVVIIDQQKYLRGILNSVRSVENLPEGRRPAGVDNDWRYTVFVFVRTCRVMQLRPEKIWTAAALDRPSMSFVCVRVSTISVIAARVVCMVDTCEQ